MKRYLRPLRTLVNKIMGDDDDGILRSTDMDDREHVTAILEMLYDDIQMALNLGDWSELTREVAIEGGDETEILDATGRSTIKIEDSLARLEYLEATLRSLFPDYFVDEEAKRHNQRVSKILESYSQTEDFDYEKAEDMADELSQTAAYQAVRRRISKKLRQAVHNRISERSRIGEAR